MENNTYLVLQRNKKLVLTGAFSALVVVLGITKIGLIPIGATASITILQIPVILIVMLSGLWEGVFVGFTFGILSLIQAAMSPNGLLDPLFVNPLCSVLPRVLFAIIAWGLWRILNISTKVPKIVNAVFTSFLSTICHTLLVLGCVYLFEGKAIKEAMGGLGYFALIASLSFNAILEAVASTIICSSVYSSIYISAKKKSKLLSSK